MKKWQVKKLEEVLEKVIYTKKIPRKNFLNSGQFPIVSQEESFINGFWDNEKDLFKILTPIIIFGDHTQILKYINFDFVLGADGIKILKPKSFLNPKFFYYFLRSLNFKNLGYARHYKLLKEHSITYPESLDEQERIVMILDEVFEGIEKAKENTEKNLHNSRELFESYVNNIFTNQKSGWEEKKLSEICEKITDGTHQTPTYYDSGFIFLSSRNVTSGKINWDRIRYIDSKQHIEMHKRVSPRLNDILLAKNGTTGVAAIVDKDIDFDIYVSLALLRPRTMILPHFLLHFINSPVAKKQFNKRLKGIGVPNLHLQEIREVIISFPESLTEQRKIVKEINELSNKTKLIEENYKKKLLLLEELKKSMLHKAFNEEL